MAKLAMWGYSILRVEVHGQNQNFCGPLCHLPLPRPDLLMGTFWHFCPLKEGSPQNALQQCPHNMRKICSHTQN